MKSGSPSDDASGQPMTFLAAAMWTILVFLVEMFVAGMTEAGRAGAFVDIVSRTGCQALAYSVVFFAILRVHEPTSSIRHVLAVRRPAILAVLLCIVVGVAISLPSEWMGEVLEAKFPRPPEEKEAYDRLLSVATSGRRIALFVTVVLVQPIFDELFYRGALFTPLRRTRAAETVVVATAAFETLSSGTRAMMILLVASLVFSWIRAATGSIFPSITARIAYMATGALPLILGRELPKPTAPWVAGSVVAAIAGLLGLAQLSRNASARRLDEPLS